MDALELRVVEVKSALDVGMTEIKGSLALLVQASEHTKTTLADLDMRNRTEFARLEAQRVADQRAQSKKDDDQEKRLRTLEHRVYMAMGALTLITTGGVLLHFVH